MEELTKLASGYVALSVEATAAAVTAFGMIEVLVSLTPDLLEHKSIGKRLMFGCGSGWGCCSALNSNWPSTPIAPIWTDVGQLASIATIRTVLNYFVEADIENCANETRGGQHRPPPFRRPAFV
jgi:Protein of unknown function (DUF1622)